ncbi:MAG: 50S ribosomal protein L21 [Bacteroidota bacterium]
MYAIIKSGGKQLRVEPGQVVSVEKLPLEAGNAVEFGEVLLVGGEGAPRVGQPLVPGAKVRATVIAQGKTRKILVFHYKPKKNIRKRRGHRQPFTRVRIDAIEVS